MSGSGADPEGGNVASPVAVKRRRRWSSNSKWNVFLDHVVDARGNKVTDYLVVEGKAAPPDRVTGVCVLPIIDGRFLLVACYRHALGASLWEAPKGFVDSDEAHAAAALIAYFRLRALGAAGPER